MATPVANVNSVTDTFEQWLVKTNVHCDLFTNNALTAWSNNTGHLVTGNSQLRGYFSANTIATDYIRGGANLESAANLAIVSNTFVGNTVTPILFVGSNVAVCTELRGATYTGTNANLAITTNTVVSGNVLHVTKDLLVANSAWANNLVANVAIGGGQIAVTGVYTPGTLNIITDANFTANVINTLTVTANVLANSGATGTFIVRSGATTVESNVVINSGAAGHINITSSNTLLNIANVAVAVNNFTGSANTITLSNINTTLTGSGSFIASYPTANVNGGKLNVNSNTQLWANLVGNVAVVGNTITVVELGKYANLSNFTVNTAVANLNLIVTNVQMANLHGNITNTNITSNVTITGTDFNLVVSGTANVSGTGKTNLVTNTQFWGEVQGNVNFTGTKIVHNGLRNELSSFCDLVTYANTDIGLTGADRLVYTVNGTYSSAKLTVQVRNGTQTQISEVLLSANGSDSHVTVYGSIMTPANANLALFVANNDGVGNTRLYVTPAFNNMNVKLSAHLFK